MAYLEESEWMLQKWQVGTAETDSTRWIIYSARNTAFAVHAAFYQQNQF
ncbi:hypothetical protein [Geosporobacter ferrireducens]|nr:hypothetical protein [Geosporobacter ferrireducens]